MPENVAWETNCAVEANVSAKSAWNFWTDCGRGVANWNDPPAQFSLDGAFVEGSRGTTLIPGQPSLHWTIRNLRDGRSATIEMQLEQATISFEWRFEPLTGKRARISQRVTLRGENAAKYLEQAKTALESPLQAGMQRIAGLMESKCAELRWE